MEIFSLDDVFRYAIFGFAEALARCADAAAWRCADATRLAARHAAMRAALNRLFVQRRPLLLRCRCRVVPFYRRYCCYAAL